MGYIGVIKRLKHRIDKIYHFQQRFVNQFFALI